MLKTEIIHKLFTSKIMQNEKRCVVIGLTNNGSSFQLAFCKKTHRTEAGWSVIVQETIAVGKSAKALMSLVADDQELLNAPTLDGHWYFKGKRQADGSILDPIRDWNGKLVATVRR